MGLHSSTVEISNSLPCNGCGWTDICVDYAHCHFKSHPGYNKDKTKSWAASNNGKSYKVAKCEDKKGQPDSWKRSTLILSSSLREKDD
jgi:hypothetical protein